MAVIAIREIWNGRDADISSDMVRNYRRVFQIQTNSMLDGPLTVLTYSGLPIMYTPYQAQNGEFDIGSIVQGYHPRQTDDPFIWEVEVRYSSKLAERERIRQPEQARDQNTSQNPLLRPSVVKWDWVKYQKPVWQCLPLASGTNLTYSAFAPAGGLVQDSFWVTPDNYNVQDSDQGQCLTITGTQPGQAANWTLGNYTIVAAFPGLLNSWALDRAASPNNTATGAFWTLGKTTITNSAGERFDPPVEIDDTRLQLTISRNEPFFDQALTLQYQDAVNSDLFMGIVGGLGKFDSINGESAFEAGFFYWKVTYVVHFRREGWDQNVLDAGFMALVGGVPQPIRDNLGHPITAPVLLDGAGNRLAANGTPKFLKFPVYKKVRFAPLNLP